jgi:hypothetical protein
MKPVKVCTVHKINPSESCTAPAICFVLVHERVLFADTHAINFCADHLASEFQRGLDERNYYWSSNVIPIPPWVIPS